MSVILLIATALVTIACLAALELSALRLPEPLLSAQEQRKNELIAISNQQPWITWLSRAILVGYFAGLVLLGMDTYAAEYIFLFFTLGWTGLSMFNAPNIQHRVAVPFYELSLLLNGAVLALAFWK